jgi:hypothetical protein
MGVHLCKRGCIFVTIYTGLALNKQIFAAAHELYHIYRYVNDQKDDFAARGSLLTTKEADTPAPAKRTARQTRFSPQPDFPKMNMSEVFLHIWDGSMVMGCDGFMTEK